MTPAKHLTNEIVDQERIGGEKKGQIIIDPSPMWKKERIGYRGISSIIFVMKYYSLYKWTKELGPWKKNLLKSSFSCPG